MHGRIVAGGIAVIALGLVWLGSQLQFGFGGGGGFGDGAGNGTGGAATTPSAAVAGSTTEPQTAEKPEEAIVDGQLRVTVRGSDILLAGKPADVADVVALLKEHEGVKMVVVDDDAEVGAVESLQEAVQKEGISPTIQTAGE
jgi:hypothetical protein